MLAFGGICKPRISIPLRSNYYTTCAVYRYVECTLCLWYVFVSYGKHIIQTVMFRFAKTYFHRWSQKISDKRQNACRAWGWLILGRYRRLVGRGSRRQSPSAEREGHRAPPFSATPPEFGERAVCETFGQDNYFWEQMFILPRFLRSILNDERWLVFLVMFILAAHVVGLVVIVLFYWKLCHCEIMDLKGHCWTFLDPNLTARTPLSATDQKQT